MTASVRTAVLGAVALVGLTGLTGCRRNYTVIMGEQPSATAHYVIVKTKWTGAMKVFDCQSQPTGDAWNPTCKQVKMQSHMGEVLDDTWSKVKPGGGE